MKRVYFSVVYVVLSIAGLVMASGAPTAWTGSGGG